MSSEATLAVVAMMCDARLRLRIRLRCIMRSIGRVVGSWGPQITTVGTPHFLGEIPLLKMISGGRFFTSRLMVCSHRLRWLNGDPVEQSTVSASGGTAALARRHPVMVLI